MVNCKNFLSIEIFLGVGGGGGSNGLMLNVQVNNFSVIGMEPPLPGYYQYFLGGKYVLLKDTTLRPEWGSNPRPLDPKSEVLTTRPPRPLLA